MKLMRRHFVLHWIRLINLLQKIQQVGFFIKFLKQNGIVVNLRKSRGKDINAACGQLANKKQKLSVFKKPFFKSIPYIWHLYEPIYLKKIQAPIEKELKEFEFLFNKELSNDIPLLNKVTKYVSIYMRAF